MGNPNDVRSARDLTSRVAVAAGLLAGGVPQPLVDETLDAFAEAKRRYYLGDYRPQAVDGGRFSEAVGRIFELATTGTFTPLSSNTFKMDAAIKAAEAAPATSASDAMRLHIPRTLKLIYDIRNRRNTAHLRDGIDPNLQDATLIVNTMNWVLAELVREHHNVSAADAQAMIEQLVAREVPMIQEFDGLPKLLTVVPAGDHCLILLYWAGGKISRASLDSWVPSRMRKNLSRTLSSLDQKLLVHVGDGTLEMTNLGYRYVEERRLIAPL